MTHNVGSVSAFNVTAKMVLSFMSNENPPHPVQTVVKDVLAESIPAGASAQFYLVNQSSYLVQKSPYESVTLQVAGERIKRTVALDHSGDDVSSRINMIFGLPPTVSKWSGDTIVAKKP
jgi:hypothetical protein